MTELCEDGEDAVGESDVPLMLLSDGDSGYWGYVVYGCALLAK